MSSAVVASIVLDTGALMALERRSLRMTRVLRAAKENHLPLLSPAVTLSEWWRARTDVRATIETAVEFVSITPALAKLAGEAMGRVSGATVVDTLVVALAAQRGGVVYTSDIDDLERLTRHFPGVRILHA